MNQLLQISPERTGVERARHTQRSRERTPPLGGVQALRFGMKPRPPTGGSPPQIESQVSVHEHDPEQLTGLRSGPAADAGTYRAATP
jgi:hypothetical protein